MTQGKQFLKIVLILLGVLVVGILATAATKPDEFRYTRTAEINASAGKIFPMLNNLQNWNTWSPWADLDPAATITYEGPKSGKGASMHWTGNNKVGEGTMTIAESQPNKRVLYALEFMKPMKGAMSSEITVEIRAGQPALVSWASFGPQSYLQKVMGVVMNCESMMNKQMDKGLANLKGMVEPKK